MSIPAHHQALRNIIECLRNLRISAGVCGATELYLKIGKSFDENIPIILNALERLDNLEKSDKNHEHG
jgi:hypothetical protein